jgi:hypothetical protein
MYYAEAIVSGTNLYSSRLYPEAGHPQVPEVQAGCPKQIRV